MMHHTLRVGWWLLLLSLLLTVLLTVGRFTFPLIGQYRASVESQLSSYLGLPVGLGQLETSWRGPFPKATIDQLSLDLGYETGGLARLSLDRVSFELNLWDSLLNFAPIFQAVEASGFQLELQQRSGEWWPRLPVDQNTQSHPEAIWWLADLLLVQPHLKVEDSRFEFQVEQGPRRALHLNQLLLENQGDHHQLSGQFWIPTLGKDTQIEFAIRSDGEVRSFRQRALPFYLRVDQLGRQLFDLYEGPVNVTDLEASAELWGALNGGRLDWLAGDLSVDRAWISLPDSDLRLQDSRTRFQVLPLASGYQIQLHETYLADAEESFHLPSLAVDLAGEINDSKITRLMAEGLDLGRFSAWLAQQPVSPSVTSVLTQLKPVGQIERLSVDLSDLQQGPQLAADLHNLGVESWRGVPELKGVSGRLLMNTREGELHLVSDDLRLFPVGVYDEPLIFDTAAGQLNWRVSDQALFLDAQNLNVRYQNLDAASEFSVDLPFDLSQQAMLSLSIGLKDAAHTHAQPLTPRSQVGDLLYNWLGGALTDGSVTQAGLVVYTPLRELENRPRPSVELFVEAQGVGLDYQNPWPEVSDLDGRFHLRDGEFTVEVDRAQVADQAISSGLVWKLPGQEWLNIEAGLIGDLAPVDRLFRGKALAESVGNALGDWHLDGAHQSQLGIRLSLENSALQPQVQVRSAVTDGRFVSEQQRVDFTQINGQVQYDSESGLSFTDLRARFLESDISASAASEKGKTEVQFSGQFDSGRVLDWVQLPLEQIVQGPLRVNGRLSLCAPGVCASQLQLESNLKEAQVVAPAYLAKASGSASRLSLMVGLTSPASVQLNYADRLRGQLLLSTPVRGNLRVGGAPAKLPDQSVFLIDGQLPELDLTELYTLIDDLKAVSEPQTESETIWQSDLAIERARIGDLYVADLITRYRQQGAEIQLALSGGAEGLITLSADGAPHRVDLNRIQLQSRAASETSEPSQPSLTDPAVAAQIPEIDLNVKDLVWQEISYGHWQGELRTRELGVSLYNLVGELPGLRLEGSADWNLGALETSKIVLNYQGEDLGDTLASLGETRLLETDRLSGTLGLIWAGAPWQYATERLDGYLSFIAKDGRLIESGSGSGILRLFGILNLNSLARRLTLDFTDIFAKGIVFDRLAGEYVIQQGRVTSAQPLSMEGPSANLSATGQISLVDKTLNQEVQVVLPLVSNTPLAAVLLGAPQVAGALFVIDKLFGDRLDRATAISYTLQGSWSDPELQLKSNAEN